MKQKSYGIISANKLFDRTPEVSYLEEWKALLALPSEREVEAKETSHVVFCLRNEWFAMQTLAFFEISELHAINPIPYHHDETLIGVVNLRGQLRLCFSLHVLLGLENNPVDQPEKMLKMRYPRLMAVTDDQEIWVFPVESVEGIYQFDLSKMENVPINMLSLKENYLQGIIKFNEKRIYILDDTALFANLRRRLA